MSTTQVRSWTGAVIHRVNGRGRLDQGQCSLGSTRGQVFGILPLLLPCALTSHPRSQPPFALKNETIYNWYNFLYLAELRGGLDFCLLCGSPIPLEKLGEGKGENCGFIRDISRTSQTLPTSPQT